MAQKMLKGAASSSATITRMMVVTMAKDMDGLSDEYAPNTNSGVRWETPFTKI